MKGFKVDDVVKYIFNLYVDIGFINWSLIG